ncbi:MAG TPA: HAD-IC family P-type ATPase, partial [Woeseiaceae bacterium]|nr:HAD-IC family P-type ATPase [Woeseiaceae bacterium]
MDKVADSRYPPADDGADLPWHARKVDEVLDAVRSTRGGLSEEEAARRLQDHGPNELPETSGRHPLIRFLSQFHNALIYFLLAAVVATLLLRHYVDAAVILAVVLANAIVGYVQEGKAERALHAIRNLIAPHAHLVRAGRRELLPVRNIVPGDVVLLEAGNRVPADLRLIRARSFLVEEAILTGESVAAEKHVAPAGVAAPLGDRHCMAYSGTFVAAGHAAGVAVGTGTDTEIGRISTLLGSVETLTTPLLRQINRFGTRFTWIALAVAAALFVFAVLLRGYAWQEALVVVVALAVGAVPEGLPAVITITLAIGVQRMAQRNAAIRRLPAVETLGATTVICSDKTGTLTYNQMMAQRVELAAGRIDVTGSGYSPEGALEPATHLEGETLLTAAIPLLRAAVLCNSSELRESDGHWKVSGDPMEGALLALAMKAGLDPGELREEWSRIDAIPFDARHRFMATLNRSGDGESHIFVKGAPERVLQMCRTQGGNESLEPLAI